MKRLVVAVSGGIDSVVLLDTLAKDAAYHLVIAHFDHGIRPESDADARFVAGLAAMHELPFELKREELGKNASEELARTRRYGFLREIATKHQATIATAHHADDVIETIAINIHRGTGWRGLTVLDNPNIVRPLLDIRKQDIRDYALVNRLEWVEDETNRSDTYLRNQLRFCLNAQLPLGLRERLMTLWQEQCRRKQAIAREIKAVLTDDTFDSRYFFTHIDSQVALELLRSVLLMKNQSLTRPQRQRLLHAIKTARAGNVYQAGSGVTIRFSTTKFVVETP